MTNYTKIALALFALTIVGLGVPMANAANDTGILYQSSPGIATLETDSIAVRVTGNNQAPHFHWWNMTNAVTDYHVMFVKMFNANDTNADGKYETSIDTILGDPFMLPTTGWNFSDFLVIENEGIATEVHFNFTTTESEPSITVCVHMYADKPNEFKFDIIVENWQWADESSILVLMFTLTTSIHGEPGPGLTPAAPHKVANKWSFGEAYFEYCETATAAENSVEVKSSFGDGDAIYLAFENYGDETLVYDPILGISSSETIVSLDPITIGLVGGIAIIAMLAIVLIRRR